jgi:hypothetical protein
MSDWTDTLCTAFAGSRCIALGTLKDVAFKVKNIVDKNPQAAVLIFDDATGEVIDVDFRGSSEDIQRRLAKVASKGSLDTASVQNSKTPRGPGRPRLGVIAREVTLLPRHWDWLNAQSGGCASVALRKLIDKARKSNSGKDRIRQAQEVSYRFISAMAGNQPGFEEATRALFAGDQRRFEELVATWPEDIRDHAGKLAADAFQSKQGESAA